LDALVAEAGGALYPAKDARMQGAHFRRCYPQLKAFLAYRDPGITSSFWQRVMADSPLGQGHAGGGAGEVSTPAVAPVSSIEQEQSS
jgi:hypothetical protein